MATFNVNTLVMGALAEAEQQMNLLKVATDVSDKFDGKARTGATVNFDKPMRLRAFGTRTLQEQDLQEVKASLTIDKTAQVPMKVSDTDLALNIDNFKSRLVKPAVATAAAKIEGDIFPLAVRGACASVGTPGTGLTKSTLSVARATFNALGCPDDGQRNVVLNAFQEAQVGDSLSSLYNERMVKNAVEGGAPGTVMGFEKILYSVCATTQITGTRGKTGATLTAAPTLGSSTLAITGGGASATIKAGEILKIAGVYIINPLTGLSTGVLAEFVVAADVSLNASGAGTITVITPMRWRSATATDSLANYGDLSGQPANGAAVSFIGDPSSAYNIGYSAHKSALAYSFADLPVPFSNSSETSGEYAASLRDKDTGASMAFARRWDIISRDYSSRLDADYGVCVWEPLYCLRVIS